MHYKFFFNCAKGIAGDCEKGIAGLIFFKKSRFDDIEVRTDASQLLGEDIKYGSPFYHGLPHFVAGEAGFEPTHTAVKVLCLTA